MLKYTRKNSKLNAAASGLAGGLQVGLGIGMQARRAQDDRDQQQFVNEQALKRASLIDKRLAQEDADRAAASEAAGAMAEDAGAYGIEGAPVTSSPRPFAMAGTSKPKMTPEDQAAIERVSRIARELPPELAGPFVKRMQESHAKIKDESERKKLADEIASAAQDSSLFAIQPDGTMVESPEVQDSLDKLTKALAAGAPVEAIKVGLVGLRQATAQGHARQRRKMMRVNALDGEIATQVEKFGQLEGANPAMANATMQQLDRMQTLREQYNQFADLIEADAKSRSAFLGEWDKARRGIAYVNPRTGREITYAEADNDRENESVIQALTARAKEAEIRLKDASARRTEGNIGNDLTRASAALIEAKNRRTRESKPMFDPADFIKFRAQALEEVLLAPGGEKLSPDQVEEQVKERTDALLDDARTSTIGANRDAEVLGDRPASNKPKLDAKAKAEVTRIKGLPKDKQRAEVDKLISSGMFGDPNNPEDVQRAIDFEEALGLGDG